MAQDMMNINEDILRLFNQQQQTQTQPVFNSGLLSGDQQNFGDVLANPDQAQVNAGIAGVASLLSGRDAGTALINSANAFGKTRQQTYTNQLAANKLERETLRDRLSSAINVGNFQNTQGQLAINAAKEFREGKEFNITEFRKGEEFKTTEQRLQEAQDFKEKLEEDKLEIERAKAGEIYEQEIGRDQFGGVLKQKVHRNPITNKETVLSGTPSTTTTPARLAEINELKGKSIKALREGSNIFFEDNLDTIFGLFEARPMLGSVTEGRVAGESTELKNKYNRFVTERVLDVARILAPVTEVDVNLLMKQLAPGVTFGSAKEARAWYTGSFIPKVLSEVRFSASPLVALDLASQVINPKMAQSEIGTIIGLLPKVEEIINFPASKKQQFWEGPVGSPAEGRALTLPIIKALAKTDGLTIDQYILKGNLKKVTKKGTNK